MDANYETLLVERRERVLWIRLNRPERRNAINDQMLEELRAVFSATARGRDTRAVVLGATGSAFSAGADLGDTPDARPSMETLASSTRLYEEIEDLPQPVIGMVQGIACAGGLELLLCCDLIVASRAARFADIHAGVGLIPGAGGAWRLPRWVGLPKAKEMLYTGDVYSAEEMSREGLVARLAEPEGLEEATAQLAAQLAAHSPLGLAAMKRLANSALDAGRAAHMESALEENRRHLETADYGEGLAAMAEKRHPVYRWA